MSDAPSAACRPVKKALVKRVSRSETSTPGSPTSRNTDATAATKLRAAVSAVAVLKVGTSHTRPVRWSMCTCRKGDGQLEEVQADTLAAAREDRQGVQQTGRRQVVCLHALTGRAGAHLRFYRRRQAGPPQQAARQG